MTNWKSMFFRLVELTRPEKTVNDEAEIIGWATHEDGQHYPIHAAQGGGARCRSREDGSSSREIVDIFRENVSSNCLL